MSRKAGIAAVIAVGLLALITDLVDVGIEPVTVLTIALVAATA